MTTTLLRPTRTEPAAKRRWQHAVPLIAVAAVAMRLPMLGHPAGPDEAGFLAVGHQWHAGGSSLYGDYWVDRPPLLITIFRLADQLGGLMPLRLIGCLATALVVLGSAHVARRAAGDRAATWAAVTAAVLCISPLLGTARVNGELLSAPFVVGGLAAALTALRGTTRRQVVTAAALSGVAFAASMLIKQNIADVGVFTAVAGLIAWRRGEISTRHLGHLLLAFLAGAMTCLTIVMAWSMAHGTSPRAVFEALYPFRVAAGRVLAASTGSHAPIRFWALIGAMFLSGIAVVILVTIWATVSRRLHGTVVWALAATLAFDVASVMMGGNYWHHYLIQLVVPVAIVSGLLVARRQPGMTRVVAGAAAVAIAAWAITLPPRSSADDATQVGTAIASVASTQDTIVTLYGHAETTQASGLPSPYPYLWSLPVKTLDPQLHTLNAVLEGPRAPTWIVVANHVHSWGLSTATTSRLITDRYHPVAHPFGGTVYLRDGAVRPALHLTGSPS